MGPFATKMYFIYHGIKCGKLERKRWGAWGMEQKALMQIKAQKDCSKQSPKGLLQGMSFLSPLN